MKKKWLVISALTIAACAMGLTGCGKKDSTKEEDTAEEEQVKLVDQVAQEDVPQIEGYELLWNDEFNGTKIDDSIWSYDPHEPGWTNEELQEYTESTDNVFVRDGKMVLKAIKTQNENGKDYYTSGKIKSQNKKDFMYGKVVARAKVPAGQGLWPAIWMMPTDESFYGQWPKCGEIDIMEILGSQPDLTYATIHYGSPHAEQQDTYQLSGETFADDFHDYSVEWEPGEMRFYVDDNLIHTVNDWFTAEEGQDDKPYPAPFNQNFFVQMNLAVGGTWPGNPDDTTDFDKAEFEIDYVRVYQKPEYDTNVEKPVAVFREALEDGNLVYNGDFAEAEALDDEEIWSFLLFEGGAGSAVISDGVLTITSDAEGSEDYSVQIVQPSIPMVKGTKYKLTFEAYAAEERDMIVCVSAPTAGWIRYLPDTTLSLGTDWKEYSYEFEMTEKDDNNGRLEFNMGHKGSTAEINIRNVRIEVVE